MILKGWVWQLKMFLNGWFFEAKMTEYKMGRTILPDNENTRVPPSFRGGVIRKKNPTPHVHFELQVYMMLFVFMLINIVKEIIYITL